MKGLEQIIGHQEEIAYLQRIIEQDKPAHAYLFSGSRGLGKRNIARSFVKGLQKSSSTTLHDCKIIDTKGKSIGVDLIREKLVEDTIIAPFSKPYKIYLIYHAEKLTPQAQNAMLKTLEEPPSYVVIILLVNDETKILPTVKSRCVQLRFVAPPEEQSIEFLMKRQNLTREQASLMVKLSDGNVGRAITFADAYEDGKFWKSCHQVLTHLEEMKTYEILSFVKTMTEDNVDFFLAILYAFYKDMLYYKLSRDANAIVLKDLRTTILKNVNTMSYEAMYNSVDAIVEAIRRLQANANRVTVFEILLLTIKENQHATTARDTV